MRAIPRFLAPSILKSSQRGKFAPEPRKLIEPKEHEIAGLAGRMAMDFNSSDQEVQPSNIRYMLLQHTLGRFMNECLLEYRSGYDVTSVIGRWQQKNARN
ncbi:hypothetical protein PY91_11665 [Lacticaseibacillus rhamnosus]|nr:hypothetical protein PY91_11665 [Lacticaseibacillus rhamnosus]